MGEVRQVTERQSWNGKSWHEVVWFGRSGMGRKMKIHKYGYYWIYYYAVCGNSGVELVRGWKKVTCKKCLKKRGSRKEKNEEA